MKVLMLGWEFPPHISGGLGTACFGLTRGLDHHGVEVLFVVPRAHGDEDERFVDIVGANRVPTSETVREKRVVRRAVTTFEEREIVEPRVERVRWTEEVELPAGDEASKESPRPSSALTRAVRTAESVALPADPVLERVLEIIAVDSALTPYLTERTYALRLAGLRARATSSAFTAPEPVSASLEPSAKPDARDDAALEATLALQREARAPARPSTRQVEREALAVVGELRRILRVPRETIEESEEETERVVTRPPFAFSGLYGPDLMSEVARFALAVTEIARTREFDVIHAHDWMTVPAALAAKRVSGKKLVLHVHACEYDRSGEKPNTQVREIEQLGLDGADRIVCVSHYTRGVLQRRYKLDEAKVRVVHNAVTHKEQLARIHEEKRIDEPIVLFLGRVTFQKGPEYFLEAAARVVRVMPKVKFVMSGSGDMLPAMIERAARLGLARHVHFTGFLEGPDVERMYAMADLYVMPSVSEPFGISPLEAMALDVPVIVSRQSGVSEVLRNALKVDFWDVDDLANKMLALLTRPALREQLTDEGSEEVRRLRWEVPAGLVRDVYRELVP